MYQRILIVMLSLIMAGCATPYKPPTSGPTASLEIRLTDAIYLDNSTVYLGDDYLSGDTPTGYAYSRPTLRHKASSGKSTYTSSTVIIPAGKALYLKYRGDADRHGNRRCIIHLKFIPQQNTHYVFSDAVTFGKKEDANFIDKAFGLDYESTCYVSLMQRVEDKLQPVNIQKLH